MSVLVYMLSRFSYAGHFHCIITADEGLRSETFCSIRFQLCFNTKVNIGYDQLTVQRSNEPLFYH